jgi:hypothetical protein
MTNFRKRHVEKKKRKSKLDIKWSKKVLKKSNYVKKLLKSCQKIVKKSSKSCPKKLSKNTNWKIKLPKKSNRKIGDKFKKGRKKK